MFDFSNDDLRKIFDQKFWKIFQVVLPFWPLKVWLLQKWPPHHCLWPPFFYCRNLFHSKNADVCKKLELNPLRFDRDIRVWSKKIHFQKYSFFRLANFWNFFCFHFKPLYLGQILPDWALFFSKSPNFLVKRDSAIKKWVIGSAGVVIFGGTTLWGAKMGVPPRKNFKIFSQTHSSRFKPNLEHSAIC